MSRKGGIHCKTPHAFPAQTMQTMHSITGCFLAKFSQPFCLAVWATVFRAGILHSTACRHEDCDPASRVAATRHTEPETRGWGARGGWRLEASEGSGHRCVQKWMVQAVGVCIHGGFRPWVC
eukprot:1260820-Rhodomonas_salina.1